MLAHAPLIPLPPAIINRPKSGFSAPMRQWLNTPANQRRWAETPLLAPSGTPWTRHWSQMVIDAFIGQDAAARRPAIMR
jgi:hypothetical protein